MKFVTIFLRIFVGLLLVFSGLIKLNDPLGFQYKMEEYFSVFSKDLEPVQDSIQVKITSGGESFLKKYELFNGQQDGSFSESGINWKPIDNEYNLPIISDYELRYKGERLFQDLLISDDSLNIATPVNIEVIAPSGEVIFSKNIEKLADFNNNDNWTFSVSEYTKSGGFLSRFFDGLIEYALIIAVAICVFEVVLGFGLLIGWHKKIILITIFLMMLFFTFLTFYSAYYNKVTDCGCFGNAIPLSPWESFSKDVVLIILTILLLWKSKYISPIFSNPFGARFLSIIILLSSLFAVRNWYFLPYKNFLKFTEGSDINELIKCPEGAPEDIYENVFIYSKDGLDEEFTLAELSERDLKEEGYEFKDRNDKLIQKGCEPEVHDFKLTDASGETDYSEVVLNEEGNKLLIISHVIEKARQKNINKLKELISYCGENGISVYWATSSSMDAVELFKSENNIEKVEFLYGDDTNLKSIIRSNPGVLLLENTTILKTYPNTNLPSIKKFEKLLK
jgi:uncharacterized membrane protein YphA (DoxX/SURF4 family)/predicted peroxiredoxin